MKQTNPTKSDIAREYVERYIELGIKNKCGYSKKFIARVLYAENKERFKDEEDARNFIRIVTNSYGTKKISDVNEELTRKFALIADGYNEEITGLPFVIPKQYKKPLIIADIHSVFWEKWAFMAAVEDGVKHNCDSVIINGDFIDFYQYSKFSKDQLTIERALQEKEWGIDVLSAHSHLSQSVFRQNINGQPYGSWTIGCLCHLHPRYNPMNNWNLGFARAERESSGDFEVINRRFIGKKHYPA